MTKRIVIDVPAQVYEIEIDDEDFDMREDPDYLYEMYIHHYVTEIGYSVSIWDGDKKVSGE